jgi:hypothetical protein
MHHCNVSLLFTIQGDRMKSTVVPIPGDNRVILF